MYRWCCSVVVVTPGLAVADRCQVAFRVLGVCPAPRLWLYALCSCCFFPWCPGRSLMLLFGCTQGCWVPCVLLCLFPPPPCSLGCRHWLFGGLFVCSRSCVAGPCSWAGSPSCAPFGVSCCCLRCYTCSPYVLYTIHYVAETAAPVLSVTAQRAGAGVSGLHHGRRGVALAPRFQLYVHCVALCRARGGCRAAVSLSGASMVRGAVKVVC